MKQSLDKLVQKYLQCKPLSDTDAIAARREYARRELERWRYMFAHGCSDPAWPDGLTISTGKWFESRCKRFEQTGHRVQIAGAEISLF